MSVHAQRMTLTVDPPGINYISIRALHAASDQAAWFAGSHGVWGYTSDAGKSWYVDSLKIDSAYREFRSLAVVSDSVILMASIASPAYIVRTTDKGKTWKVVYKNSHPEAFLDCIRMTENGWGWAIGDPVNGHFLLLQTKDFGNTWSSVPSEKPLTALEGESLFASSNSNLDFEQGHLWFITGGKHSRLFHSSDSGRSFLATDIPIEQGEKMTGAFSFDMFDPTTGVIVGGNYERTSSSIRSLAVRLPGKNWEPVPVQDPFFGSCVQFMNRNEVLITGHHGTFRLRLNNRSMIEVVGDKGNKLQFHVLRISPSGKTVWMAGSRGRILRLSLSR